MKQFFWGILTMASITIAAFFLRYWRASRDRLFVLFALAFVALAVNWLGLAIIDPANESRHYIYLVRLLAFGLIAAAIVDKNRRGS